MAAERLLVARRGRGSIPVPREDGKILPPVTRFTLMILVLLAAAIALARLRFVHDLPDWDVASYSLIGREMVHGKKLYLDVWDMKPPAIFASYAAANAVFGSWERSAYALAVMTAAATMLAVYFAAAGVDRRAGLWAAAL